MATPLFRVETSGVRLEWSRVASKDPASHAPGVPPAGLVRLSGGGPEPPRLINPRGDDTPVLADWPPRLFEETGYSILLRSLDDRPVGIRHPYAALLSGLTRSADGKTVYGPLSFRGQIGRSAFEVLHGGELAFGLEVEVFPTKLDYADDYEKLLAEVQGYLTALVIDYLRATTSGADLVGRGETELEWVLLLQHFIAQLERGLEMVSRRPVRRLERTVRMVRAQRVRRVDGALRRAVRRGRGQGELVPLGSLKIRQRLPETRATFTLDTPEHRWLALQLRRCSRRLSALTEAERARLTRNEKISSQGLDRLARLNRLSQRLARLSRLEPLEEANGPPPAGFSSLLLQSGLGYGVATRALLALQLGLRVQDNALQLSLKDLATLYEYWCFLAMLRILKEETKAEFDPRELVGVRQAGLAVLLKKGKTTAVPAALPDGRMLTMKYNPSFAAEPLKQEPDLAIELNAPGWPPTRLVADAKYRVDFDRKTTKRFGHPAPPPDSINVLHRYRDAILSTRDGLARTRRTVVEGAVLFPLQASGDGYADAKLHKTLESVGIGALPFLPGSEQWVRQWVRRMVGRGNWALSDRDISAPLVSTAEGYRRAAHEVVLVGLVPRKDFETRLAWIHSQQRYFVPRAESQARQLGARYVALYEGAGGQEPGVVRWYAPVVSVEVGERGAIDTPWRARNARESCVTYRLGEWLQLVPPLRRTGALAVRRYLYSSHLALQRARTLPELFLETEVEWRLYEGLLARGWAVEVRAATLPPLSELAPRGHAQLLVRRDGTTVRCRYRGAGGIEVEFADRRQFAKTVSEALRIVEQALTAPTQRVLDLGFAEAQGH